MKPNPIIFLGKLAAVAAVSATTLFTAASAYATGSSTLVIAEVYGAGGNSGATYQNDFVVIFNRSTSSVNMSGYSIQYASATGSTWQTAALTNSTIPAGSYYLVKMASTAAVGAVLPLTPDSTNTINMSGTAGKVALVNTTTALSGANPVSASIVDLVGFGTTANGYEGTGPTPAPSATTSVQRGNSGCTDTDNNSTDFTAGSPNPRNSATATHSCAVVAPPTIAGILPLSITTNAGNTVSFTVTNSTGDVPLTYFWYKETASTTNLISVVTTNTTSGTLTLSSVLRADAANYQVVVSNANVAFLTATSAVVSLSVIDPAINVQPVSQTGLPKGSAQFSVAAGGTGLSYHWYYCTSPSDNTQIASSVSNGTQVSGSVNFGSSTSTLLITNLQAADPTNFVVVVTGTYGSVTSSVASLAEANTTALALWNFNNPYLNANNPAPYQGIGTALATNVGPFQSPTQDANDGSNPNASWGTQNYPASGLNKQAGVQFNVSTVGAKNVNVSYDVRGTSTASKYQRLQFTTNGTDWVDYPANSSILVGQVNFFQSRSFSLAGFPGVANNPNFGIRIVAEFESTALYNNTNDANYVGISSTYNGGGTLTYDLVNITADAITGNNQPPTVSAIPNQTMNDTAGTVANFTVSDDTDAAGSLAVAATSLDPNVSLSLTPVNTGGAVQLSINSSLSNPSTVNVPVLVTVTDSNGDVSSRWFTLTITPANAAPTISSLINTNLLPNTSLTIPFNINDDHTAPSSMTPTATSGNSTVLTNDAAHILLGGSGTNRTLTITPTTNQLGTVPLTVSVSDGSLTTSQTIFVTVRPNTNAVLVENFNYDGSGSLATLAGGFWQTHSGTANQLQMSNSLATINGIANSEDVNAPLIGGPYLTNSPAVLYASFVINYTSLPDATGAYFAHFKDTTTFGFIARMWAITNAGTGGYQIGIANSSDTAVKLPQTLALGSNYVVVARLVVSNSVSTVWVNPANESSTSATDTFDITTNKVNISSFALRESNGSEGIVNLSHLKVGTTFDSVLPSLHLQPNGSAMIVNWSDPTLSIQSTTNLLTPFADMTGATPPYTNNTSTNTALFFRFKP